MKRDDALQQAAALLEQGRAAEALIVLAQVQPLKRAQRRERERASLCIDYCAGLTTEQLRKGRA